MTVTPEQVIQEANKYLGWNYGYRDRCGGSYHELDCSGLVCIVMNGLGLHIGCVTSFVLANMLWDNRLVIPTPRALDIITLWVSGPNGGRGPSQAANGSDGHTGFGNKTDTREARGHAYGVVIGPMDLSRFDAVGLIPGVDYSPQVTMEPTMIIQTHHYTPTRMVPAHKPDGTWCLATIAPTADGKGLLLKDGASITGAGKSNYGTDIWMSPHVAKHGRIVAVALFVPPDHTIPCVAMRHADGFQAAIRMT